MQQAKNGSAIRIVLLSVFAWPCLYAAILYHITWLQYGSAYAQLPPPTAWPEIEGRLLPPDTCFGHRVLTSPFAILTIQHSTTQEGEALLHKLGLSVRRLYGNADRYLATTSPIFDAGRLWKQCVYDRPLPGPTDYLRRFQPYYTRILFLDHRRVLPYSFFSPPKKNEKVDPTNNAMMLWPTVPVDNISDALMVLRFENFDPTAFWTACLPKPAPPNNNSNNHTSPLYNSPPTMLHLNASAVDFFNGTIQEEKEALATRVVYGAPLTLRFLPDEEPIMMRPGALFLAKAENGTCIKLQRKQAGKRSELDIYVEMPPSVRAAFVPVLSGFEFEYLGAEWTGLCMPFIDHTLFHVMSISNRISAAIDIDRLATRFMAASLTPSSSSSNKDNSLHGIPLLYTQHKQSFEITLLTACCRLLLQLHQNGWVHGDTHLGNFMLCTRTWRVFLIDAERTFTSADPVQYLMDVQELIGHATGLIVSLFDKDGGWDMADVWGVVAKMHPTNTTPQCSLQHLLPVCTCFVQEQSSARQRGCCMCRSPLNKTQAELYMKESTAWLLQTNYRNYEDFLFRIHECRLACRLEMQDFISRLTPSLALLRRFLHQAIDTKPHYATFHRIFSQNHATMELWLKYACYHGAIVQAGERKARRLAHIFRRAGLHGLALCLTEMTCCTTTTTPPVHKKKKKPSAFISPATTFPLQKSSSILLRCGSSTLSE